MSLTKVLSLLLAAALVVWAVEALWLVNQNTNLQTHIRTQAAQARSRIELEHKQKLREVEHGHESKKHLATGDTVFDRIFNAQDQTISDMINRISQEALPREWSFDVKTEEFTHFILLVYLPHNLQQPTLEQITASLHPIVEYCGEYLTDISVFDKAHKSYLFFDKSMLAQLKAKEPLTPATLELATRQGTAFTRFNSVTVDCRKFESHLLVPIEIIDPNGGVIECDALLDTGASITMLSSEIISKTGQENIHTLPQRVFSTVNGTISCPIVRREVSIGGVRRNIEVAVSQQDTLALVGMNYFDGMDYIVDFGQSAIYMWEKK
jgi:predicted aspartyl protease